MRYLSLFSGIEAATVAWEPLGWTAAAYAETDRFPCALLEHRYPAVVNVGDVTKWDWKEWARATEPVDVCVFGSPCQSFSVAGKRLGLDDPRGNLALYALSVVREVQPRYFVFENVPGLLSSAGGRDFGAFLSAVGECGYQCAWRILDAQYFGLAQRRARLFVVGHLGDWRRAAAVLFEREGLSGDFAPSREAREGVTSSPAGIAGSVSRKWSKGTGGPAGDECYNLVPDLAGPLGGSSQSGGFRTTDLDNQGAFIPETVGYLSARAIRNSDTSNEHGFKSGELHDALQSDGPGAVAVRDVAATLGKRMRGQDDGCADNLLLEPLAFKASHFTRGKDGAPDETVPPLSADADKGDQDILIAFNAKDYGGDAGALAPTLRAGTHDKSWANGGVMPAVTVPFADLADPIATNQGKTYTREGTNNFRVSNVALTPMQVRRLTPRECERLQGFPDDYTLIPYRGRLAKDGPRYKALGNAMAVPVMRWIGQRIAAVERALDATE